MTEQEPKSKGCIHRKEWICELDDGYCASNIQIGIMCPNYKPCKVKEERDVNFNS